MDVFGKVVASPAANVRRCGKRSLKFSTADNGHDSPPVFRSFARPECQLQEITVLECSLLLLHLRLAIHSPLVLVETLLLLGKHGAHYFY